MVMLATSIFQGIDGLENLEVLLSSGFTIAEMQRTRWSLLTDEFWTVESLESKWQGTDGLRALKGGQAEEAGEEVALGREIVDVDRPGHEVAVVAEAVANMESAPGADLKVLVELLVVAVIGLAHVVARRSRSLGLDLPEPVGTNLGRHQLLDETSLDQSLANLDPSPNLLNASECLDQGHEVYLKDEKKRKQCRSGQYQDLEVEVALHHVLIMTETHMSSRVHSFCY